MLHIVSICLTVILFNTNPLALSPKARSTAPYLPNENESLLRLCFWNMLFILLLYWLTLSASSNIFSWIYVLLSSLCESLNERGCFMLNFYSKMYQAKHTHFVVAYNMFIWIVKILQLSAFNKQKVRLGCWFRILIRNKVQKSSNSWNDHHVVLYRQEVSNRDTACTRVKARSVFWV